MSRILVIDDAAKAKAQSVLDYAHRNPYFPGLDKVVPGDLPGHIAQFGTYRAVFSFTHEANDRVWRHLSISVPGKNFPNPAAAYTIAQLFGFTGWDERTVDRLPAGWIGGINDTEHCIVLAQQIMQ